MAASDARPIPRRNVAFRVTFPIFDETGSLVTGAAGLDSEVSKDGATFADCTNEATEIATASGMYFLDLTATEMDADTVAIVVKTSTVGAKTTPIVMYPEEAGDIRTDVVQISGDTTAADNLESYTDGTTPIPANTVALSGDAIAADNAESFFDGTGYAGTNNVIPTVTNVTNDVGITQAGANKVFGSSGAALPELPQAAPPATPRPDQAIMALYHSLRDRLETDASEKRIFNDAGVVIFKKTLSDNGTTYTEAEAVSGP